MVGSVQMQEQEMTPQELREEILRLKQARNAVIVAHNYQNDEVQDIADALGDSFYLSKFCAASEAECIVFCGVRFMAQSAKILSPHKTVLLPEPRAGCPMADAVTPADVKAFRAEHPGAVAVCYINTTAEVKAECDVCCTSSNAVKIVRALPQREILFLPDKNLGAFVARQVPEKHVFCYNGGCVTHNRFGAAEVEAARRRFPDAPVAVHPECAPEVAAAADFVGSTSEILDFCRRSPARRLIIGTEMGILHKLKLDNPQKEFVLLTPRLVCSNMKLTSLRSVYRALRDGTEAVTVEEDIRRRAEKCLQEMLRLA